MSAKNTITVATLAAHLGVSKATVTHVLNGRGTQLRIRPETQQRVLAAAQELGYRPNVSARAIRTGRFGCAALVQSLKALYLPTELLQGIVETLAEYNMHLSVAEVPDEVIDREAYVPKVVRELTADGLLINRILEIPPPFIQRIHTLQTPAVFLNVKQDHDSVHPNDLAGGRLATEHLLGWGHRRIVYVQSAVNEKEHYSEIDRRAGYEQAMREADCTPQFYRLPADPTTLQEMRDDQRIAVARQLLLASDRPTAVVTYELPEAMAIFHAANQLGLRVPADLSIVTFHWGIDVRLCVPFTTVTNAIRHVGREAVHMLVEKIEDSHRSLPTRSVPEILLEGGTCGPPHASGSSYSLQA